MCPHTYSCISVLMATTMYKNDYTQVEPCDGSWVHAIVWEVCVTKKIEFLMCCTLNLSHSGTLKEKRNETLTPAVAEPAGFTLTRFTIGSSLNICVLISTSTYVTSYLILYMCPQPHGVLHIFLYRVLSQHRPPRLCLAHARRYRERHRCVRACVIVRACVCLCVCACVYICTHFLCVALRLLCLRDLPFSPRYEVYICPRPAIFIAVMCTNNVSLYRHICAVKRRYCAHGSL